MCVNVVGEKFYKKLLLLIYQLPWTNKPVSTADLELYSRSLSPHQCAPTPMPIWGVSEQPAALIRPSNLSPLTRNGLILWKDSWKIMPCIKLLTSFTFFLLQHPLPVISALLHTFGKSFTIRRWPPSPHSTRGDSAKWLPLDPRLLQNRNTKKKNHDCDIIMLH